MRPRNILILLLVSLCLLRADAAAQAAGRDEEKERAIRQQLQAISPSSVEAFKQATVALDADNYAEAARLYEEVTRQAPEFTPALRRLGLSWVRTGRQAEGLALLEKAVKLERSPENLGSLAEALAYPRPDTQAAPDAKARALALASEANTKSG